MTILDDEEQAPSVVSFTESSYHAEDDTLTVEIVREGALNTIAEAKLTTVNGSAQAGRDFSPVDMSVVFPMGHRQAHDRDTDTHRILCRRCGFRLEAGTCKRL